LGVRKGVIGVVVDDQKRGVVETIIVSAGNGCNVGLCGARSNCQGNPG